MHYNFISHYTSYQYLRRLIINDEKNMSTRVVVYILYDALWYLARANRRDSI